MSVYFMRMGAGGPIKIGHAGNVYKRRTQLQSAVADAIEIMALVDGGEETEAQFHKQFSHLRLRGELFRASDDLLAHIQTLQPPPAPIRLRSHHGGGRPRINDEATMARFPEGTLSWIEDVLDVKESRAAFLRAAVERELKRRERAKG